MTYALTFFLAKDVMTIRLVETEGFVHQINTFYKKIQTTTPFFTKYIPNMYDTLRAKAKSELSAEVTVNTVRQISVVLQNNRATYGVNVAIHYGELRDETTLS